MDVLWYGVLVLLLAGYFALEGFDIGVGMLLPWLARDRATRDLLVGAVAPFVLAGEVWLVAAVGVLAGAFPLLEGATLGALYPLVVALLVTWVLRDAGLWFRRRGDSAGWRAFWDGVLCLGSWGLAVVWGLAVGALAGGLSGPALSPAGVVGAMVVAGVFALHGRVFVAWRLGGGSGPALAGTAVLAALPVAVPLLAAAPYAVPLAAAPGSLTVLALAVAPFVPLGVAAQVWVWRTFGRRGAAEGARVPSFF